MTWLTLKRYPLLLLCGAALTALPLVAQTSQTSTPSDAPAQNDGPPMGGHRGGGPRGGPEHRIEMLQHELNLSTDQTEQVKALFAAERTRAEALRSNNSGAPEDRRAQMMSIRQETETKLRAMLTADQATKYDAMQARMRQHMQDRQGDGPPPPPSGQPQQ